MCVPVLRIVKHHPLIHRSRSSTKESPMNCAILSVPAELGQLAARHEAWPTLHATPVQEALPPCPGALIGSLRRPPQSNFQEWLQLQQDSTDAGNNTVRGGGSAGRRWHLRSGCMDVAGLAGAPEAYTSSSTSAVLQQSTGQPERPGSAGAVREP